jgi:hypothetical protein
VEKGCGKVGKEWGFAMGWGCGKVFINIKGRVWSGILWRGTLDLGCQMRRMCGAWR